MTKSKRLLSLLLCCVMVFTVVSGLIPTAASAATVTGYDRGYTGGMAGTGTIVAHGVDVSEHQGRNFNFKNLKNNGYSYVILRCGFVSRKDYRFEENYAAAKAAGLDVGVYFYSYASTPAEASREADLCLSYIKGKTFEYPVYFDFEDRNANNRNGTTAKNICTAFMDKIAAAGYLTGLYSYAAWIDSNYGGWVPVNSICTKYECWIANYYNHTYTANPRGSNYSKRFGMWQYTSSKYIGGVGPLDTNVCYKDYPSIVKKYGFNGYSASGSGSTTTTTTKPVSYTGSASYRSGPYYSKLTSVQLTGNQRQDLVNVATSQVGYTEGNNSSQLAGTTGGSRDYTEYGRWYGMQDQWCAMFVSWCANVAGVSTSVVPKHAWTPAGLSFFQQRGQAYSRATIARGGYTPQAGDIIYFKSGSGSVSTNHIGIVTGYSNGTVYTIEGNCSRKVSRCSYSINNSYIVYICKPNYSNTAYTVTNPLASLSSEQKALVFDATYYSNKYADLKAAFGTDATKLFNHFIESGVKEGRQASPNFNVQWYTNHYTDLKAAFGTDYVSALQHYLSCGIPEGRMGCSEFDVKWYLNHYSDLKNAFGSDYKAATKHYITDGYKEGRQASADPTISNLRITEVTASGFRVTVDVNDSVTSVKFPVWTASNGQDDLVWHTATITGNTATCYIKASEHKNEYGEFIVHAYADDNRGKSATAQSSVKIEKPAITSVKISEVSASGYRVTCTFTGTVSSVKFPTWTTANGQDDMVWHEASISGNTATYFVRASQHGYEAGQYATHVYVYDSRGNNAGCVTEGANLPEASITDITVSEVSPSGYRVTCKVDGDFSSVYFPTWTDVDGQDDLIWHRATVTGNTATYYISAKEHKSESGHYITHVYGDKGTGNSISYGAAYADLEKPTISNVKVTDVDANGYRVTCTINDGFTSVYFPTWTESGDQDDIIWHKGTISGNTATCYIKTSDHNNEYGAYITDIYANHGNGSTVSTRSGATIEKPSIKDVTFSDVTTDGFRVTCKIGSTVTSVKFATWSQNNGQDDVIWHEATISGDTATYYVKTSDHNEDTGNYSVHAYGYDVKGTAAGIPTSVKVPEPDVNPLSISDVKITDVTASGYRVTCTIGKSVTSVNFPTWTTNNGQDDIVWHKGTISGNTATVYISTRDHKYETGNYATHIYAYDADGKSVCALTSGANLPKPSITDVKITDVTSNGYRVTCTFSGNITSVKFPTWTEANGQDDIKWYDGTISGNTATIYVKSSKHGFQSGKYITHIYAYDGAGNSYGVVTNGATVPAAQPVDLGTDFYARINTSYAGKNLSLNGENVIVYHSSTSYAQIWKFVRNDDGSYTIINKERNKVLDVWGGVSDYGTNVQIWDSNGSNAQKWFIYEVDGMYVFRPACSNCVLDVYWGQSDDYTNIQIWTFNGNASQLFGITKV